MVIKKKQQGFSKPFNLVHEKYYPELSIGPGIYSDYSKAKDSSPKEWIKSDIKEIEENRNKQIFSFKRYNKKSAVNAPKELQDIQWVSQSIKTTELEIETNLQKRLINEEVTGIKNIAYDLEKIKVIDNIKVPRVIDKTTSDIALKAKDAMITLHSKLKDVYKIEQLLSIGLLGIKKNRVLVPTKWSITSVDDIISKEIINNIRLNPTIDKYQLFTYEFYMNKFYIILMPYNWGFEMIESAGDTFSIDYELNNPKKEYASSVTGAYYAARLEVAKYLEKIKRQARIIIFRDIDPSYQSKGVWVIREAINNAMSKDFLSFETLPYLFKYIDNTLKIRSYIKSWTDQSNILKDLKYQKRLFEF